MNAKDTAMWEKYDLDKSSSDAINALIMRYNPIVYYNVGRMVAHLPRCVEIDDFHSYGIMGLRDAIKHFDPKHGVKFETYCVPRIRGAILDGIRSQDWVPRLVRASASKLKWAQTEGYRLYNREPSELEMAKLLMISIGQFHKLQRGSTVIGLVSLNKKWYETDSYKDVREIDIVSDHRAEDPLNCEFQKDILRLVTKGLNKVERIIVICYYFDSLTFKSIGKMVGLSESRISQMHTAIVARWRTTLKHRAVEFIK